MILLGINIVALIALGVLFTHVSPSFVSKLVAVALATLLFASTQSLLEQRFSLVAALCFLTLALLRTFLLIHVVGFLSGVALLICLISIVHIRRQKKPRS